MSRILRVGSERFQRDSRRGRLRPKVPAVRARASTFGVLLVLAAALASGQERSAASFYSAGEDLYERGDLAGALRAFGRAYALDPRSRRGDRVGMHFEDYDPAFQLGRIHARLGEFELAERYFAQCAASGYTERSGNAEEFARWKGIADRALSGARSRAAPAATPAVHPLAPTAPAAPAPAAASPERYPPPSPIGAITAVAGQTTRPAQPIAARSSPAAVGTPPPTAAFETPSPVATTPIPGVRVAAPPVAPSPSRRRALLFLGGLVLLAAGAGVALWRGRRAILGPDTSVGFGRYSITGLLGVGAASFVYSARDRKTGEAVALRIRRPDAAPALAEKFRLEAVGLERLRGGNTGEAVAPRLIEAGARRVAGHAVEYIAFERLSGRTVLDLSRNARRRPEAAVRLEILQAVAGALAVAADAGLAHPALSAADVFLIDPVPLTSGNPVGVRILGLVEDDDGGRAAAVRGVLSVALELFRDDELSPADQDLSALQAHLPRPLREILRRLDEGAPVTLAELQAALERCRSGPEAVSR